MSEQSDYTYQKRWKSGAISSLRVYNEGHLVKIFKTVKDLMRLTFFAN